ncbi:MAG: HD-GYP domain-containing protein [Deltaproteobacteria bacterium]|nr:HD-GYP domain-containing protein [Deltaproteobacteria bacterium]
MRSDALSASIHRMLLLRLIGATFVLSLLFAGIAFFNNQERMEREVFQLARVRTDQFNLYIQDLLDSSEPLSGTVLEKRMNAFVDASGSFIVQDGRFVMVRIYDESGKQIVDRLDESFEAIAAVKQAVDAVDVKPLGPGEFKVVTKRLEGLPFVGVGVPLTNSKHEVVAQIIAVFAISPEAIETIRGNILRTMLYVVGLVIGTALVIYPIIGELLGRLSRTTVKLLDSNLEILQVLGGAIAKRDSDTDAHNYRVTIYSVYLARAIDLPRNQIRTLIKGALLHDVGKLGIRDDVLLKPGKLDDDEFTIMKTHVEHGLEITDRASWLKDAQAVVGGHHEKFDGAGYPAGLQGEAIPLAARIFAITDVFDALTSRRPYKEPIGFEKSIQILESGRGSHFDPVLLDAFSDIASDLYNEYSGKDDGKPKEHLEELTEEYFKSNIEDLLNG